MIFSLVQTDNILSKQMHAGEQDMHMGVQQPLHSLQGTLLTAQQGQNLCWIPLHFTDIITKCHCFFGIWDFHGFPMLWLSGTENNTHFMPLSVSKVGSNWRILFSKKSLFIAGSRSGSSPISLENHLKQASLSDGKTASSARHCQISFAWSAHSHSCPSYNATTLP